MAVAKLSCGACGAALPDEPISCPHCGESVDLPARVNEQMTADPAGRACPVCGHRSLGKGEYCESCGASLRRGVRGPAPSRGASRGKSSRRIESWKFAVGGAVALLLILFAYLEFSRPVPPSTPAQATAPAQPPMEEVRRLQDAIRANPGDAAAVLQLANQLHDMGRSEPGMLNGAIDAYRHYLGLKPKDPDARVDLGICYFELGRVDSAERTRLFEAAVREMGTAIKESPSHQPAAFNLGVVHLFMGDTEKSTRWFRKAVEIAPESELGKRAKNLLEQHAFPPSAR